MTHVSHMGFGRFLLAVAVFFVALVVLVSPANNAYAASPRTYYVDNLSYTDVLEYDSAATTACLHGQLKAKPSSIVVFKADNYKIFYWSPVTPNLYYSNVGWSNCKAYHRTG